MDGEVAVADGHVERGGVRVDEAQVCRGDVLGEEQEGFYVSFSYVFSLVFSTCFSFFVFPMGATYLENMCCCWYQALT